MRIDFIDESLAEIIGYTSEINNIYETTFIAASLLEDSNEESKEAFMSRVWKVLQPKIQAVLKTLLEIFAKLSKAMATYINRATGRNKIYIAPSGCRKLMGMNNHYLTGGLVGIRGLVDGLMSITSYGRKRVLKKHELSENLVKYTKKVNLFVTGYLKAQKTRINSHRDTINTSTHSEMFSIKDIKDMRSLSDNGEKEISNIKRMIDSLEEVDTELFSTHQKTISYVNEFFVFYVSNLRFILAHMREEEIKEGE